MSDLPKVPNKVTLDAICKCGLTLPYYKNIVVSVSGGGDSDIVIDLVLRACDECNIDSKILKWIFFDTGIEYKATKEHLDYLEDKYKIKIERIRAKCPVPLGCKKYGLPFLSKFISQRIERLQNKNFDFANDGWKSFEELNLKYPRTKGALTWWCNRYEVKEGKSNSSFNISNNAYLKEFIIENPPTFKISAECCQGAKKDVAHDYYEENDIDLSILGLRQAEGGIRSVKIKSCYDDNRNEGKVSVFRPIFWFKDIDKKEYEDFYKIVHSKCYTEYGMKRTGCCGCPFNSRFEEDLKIVKEQEPLLYTACNNIFGPSYEYTRAYRKFRREHKENDKNGILDGQVSFYEIFADLKPEDYEHE